MEVDDDPRACYFKQVENGKYMRMALILRLLEEAVRDKKKRFAYDGETLIRDRFRCTNPMCITATEQELAHVFRIADADKGVYRCLYCEKKAES